jgi:hypothetical protein
MYRTLTPNPKIVIDHICTSPPVEIGVHILYMGPCRQLQRQVYRTIPEEVVQPRFATSNVEHLQRV